MWPDSVVRLYCLAIWYFIQLWWFLIFEIITEFHNFPLPFPPGNPSYVPSHSLSNPWPLFFSCCYICTCISKNINMILSVSVTLPVYIWFWPVIPKPYNCDTHIFLSGNVLFRYSLAYGSQLKGWVLFLKSFWIIVCWPQLSPRLPWQLSHCKNLMLA